MDPSLAAYLVFLVQCQNVARVDLFYRYYFGICSSEMAKLVPLTHFCVRYNCYSNILYGFSVSMYRCY